MKSSGVASTVAGVGTILLASVLLAALYTGTLVGALGASIVGAIVLSCAFAFLFQDGIEVHGGIAAFTPVPIVMIAIAGLYSSGLSFDTVFGIGFEFGTVGSFVLAMFAFWCGLLVRSGSRLVVPIISVLFVSVAVSLPFVLFRGERSPQRATFPETMYVIAHTYNHSLDGAVMGAGPGQLPAAWSAARSTSLNGTRWWNSGPSATVSDGATTALFFGLTGFAALCLYPLVSLWLLFLPDRRGRAPRVAAALLSLICFISMFVAPVGIGIFLLGALSCGIALAHSRNDDLTVRLTTSFQLLIAVCLMFIGIGLMGIGVQQLRASAFFTQGEHLAETNVEAAVHPLNEAARLWHVAYYEIHAAQAMLNSGILVAHRQKSEGTLDMDLLRGYIEEAMRLSGQAVLHDPHNVDIALSRAALYALIYSTGFTTLADPSGEHSIEELTRMYLESAATMDPLRADIPYAQAVFAKLTGDTAAARIFIQRALDLRPDYEEARAFEASLPR